jgi:hypothetical protein
MLFRTPALSPTWPYLPVIRPSPDGAGRQCGVLYDARNASGRYGYSATVFLANLYLVPATEAALFALPRCIYDTADELADDGWTVG